MPMIIVKAQVSGLVKRLSEEDKTGINNISSDFLPALEKKVKQLVKDSVSRAKENGRRTLMSRDI